MESDQESHEDIVTTQESHEDIVCRICRENSASRPLFHPCACAGSMKFVHEQCLELWLQHSRQTRCEVCKKEFRFSPVYAAGAPPTLPPIELAQGLFKKFYTFSALIFRIATCSIAWFAFFPVIVYWALALPFVKPSMISAFFATYTSSFRSLLDSAMSGYFIFFTALVLATFVTTCIEFCVRNADIIPVPLGADLRPRRIHQNLNQNGPPLAAAMPAPAPPAVGDNDFDDVAVAPPVVGQPIPPVDQPPAGVAVAAPVQADAVTMALEFLGFKGRFVNAATNYLFCFVGACAVSVLFVLLPLLIGKFFYPILRSFFTTLLSLLPSTFLFNSFDFLRSHIHIQISTNWYQLFQNAFFSSGDENGVLSNAMKLILGYGFVFFACFCGVAIDCKNTRRRLNAYVAQLDHIMELIDDWKRESDEREARGEPAPALPQIPPTPEERPHVTYISEILMEIYYVSCTSLKLTYGFSVHMATVPMVCGFLVDFVSCLYIQGASVSGRVEYFVGSPITSIVIHWVLGMIFLGIVSNNIKIMKKDVLRPYVLWFIVDTSDQNVSIGRSIVKMPWRRLLMNNFTELVILSTSVFLFVRMPLKLSLSMFGGLFPLTAYSSDQMFQAAMEMFGAGYTLNWVLPTFKPSETLKSVYQRWMEAVGDKLGLSQFLFATPPPLQQVQEGQEEQQQENENNENDNNYDMMEYRIDPVTYAVTLKWLKPKPKFFEFRIVVLLSLSFCAVLSVISTLFLSSLSIGRLLSPILLVLYPYATDLTRMWVGFMALLGAAATCRKVYGLGNTKEIVKIIARYILLGIKCLTLVITTAIIPYEITWCLVRLVFMFPLTAPYQTSLLSLADIALNDGDERWWGGVYVVWLYLRKRVPGIFPELNREIDEAVRVGVREMEFGRFMRKVTFPIVFNLLAFECVPYAICFGLLPLMGIRYETASLCFRFSYPILFACVLAKIAWRPVRALFDKVHASIRDERYMVGRRLSNFGNVNAQEVAS